MMIIDKKVATLPEWNEAEAIKTTNRLELFRIKDGFNHLEVLSRPSSVYNLLEEMLEDSAGTVGITLFGLGTSPNSNLCGLIRTGRIVRVVRDESGNLFAQEEGGTVFCLEKCS